MAIKDKNGKLFYDDELIICSSCNEPLINNGFQKSECLCEKLSFDYGFIWYDLLFNVYYRFAFNANTAKTFLIVNGKTVFLPNYCYLNKSNDELLNKIKPFVLL